MTRDELIAVLYEHSPLFVSHEHFSDSLAGWSIDPVYTDRGLAVIFIVNGPEFHFCKVDQGYQASKSILDKYPGELIKRFGYAVTKTPIDDTRQQRFNRRLGFREIDRDGFDIHYRIDRMRSKEKACQ